VIFQYAYWQPIQSPTALLKVGIPTIYPQRERKGVILEIISISANIIIV